MLLSTFGSRAGLLAAVVDAVEAAQRQRLERLLAEPEADPIRQAQRF